MRRENAVRGVGAKHIKVAVPKAAFSFIEHVQLAT
jgi:hypothetical protein